MTSRRITTDGAPGAIGPYSQAVVRDGWLWCSGQIAIDPATGEMVGDGRDEDATRIQTTQVLENLRAVLSAAGADFGAVVRCTVYLADLSHFAAMNEIYATFFEGVTPPSRACVQAARLPKDALVEIDCVARVD